MLFAAQFQIIQSGYFKDDVDVICQMNSQSADGSGGEITGLVKVLLTP